MQDENEELIQISVNTTKIEEVSTVTSQYSFIDMVKASGSQDMSEPEEGRELTREAGELRIKGVDFTNQALNTIIHKILDKVELQHMSQKRLTNLFCSILTFTSKYLQGKMDLNEPQANNAKDVGKPLLLEGKDILLPDDKRKFCELVDRIEESVKKNYDLLRSDKIDDFIDGIINDATKNVVTDEFRRDNSDELITKLFDDIMKLDEDSNIDHMKFNQFIDQILGKEAREYITDKIRTFAPVHQNKVDEKKNV